MNNNGQKADIFDIYMKEISKFPFLSEKEKRQLAKKAQNDDTNAATKLMQTHLRLVVFISMKFLHVCNGGLGIMDLIQVGNLGLIRAIERFKLEKKTPFAYYATFHIRAHVIYEIKRCYQQIRVPTNINGIYRNLNKTAQLLCKKFKREITAEEVVCAMNITKKQKERIDCAIKTMNPISLNALAFRSTNDQVNTKKTIEKTIADTKTPNPEKEAQTRILAEKTKKILSTLPPKESKIIRMRFGIGESKKTLQETGNKFNVCRERIRQIEVRVLRRLRFRYKKTQMDDFL